MRWTLVFLLLTIATPTSAQYSLEDALPLINFSAPVDIRTPNDGTGRLFIAERSGTIQVVPDDPATAAATEFLDISTAVESGGETGLLSLAFHPNYATNRQFFVYYTALDGFDLVSIIDRYEASADPNFAFAGSRIEVLRFDQPTSIHNGGQLAFGDDGYLYLSTGDGGFPSSASQDLTNLLGKVIRIDVDGGFPYAIPSTNPFATSPNGERPEIFAWGFRNPWRMAFDPVTDDLWLADVGATSREEIDIVKSNRNYGWDLHEGDLCTGIGTCPVPLYEAPIYDYVHSGGTHTVVGGVVYHGDDLPALRGDYIFGDFASGSIWSLEYDFVNPAVRSNVTTLGSGFVLSTFGVDANGEVLVASLNGDIYRITNPNAVATPLATAPGLRVWQNEPNPFNPSTTLRFSLETAGEAAVIIFDVSGRRVRELTRQPFDPGAHEVRWDGRNDGGTPVVSGVYFAQVSSGAQSAQVRMVLTK